MICNSERWPLVILSFPQHNFDFDKYKQTIAEMQYLLNLAIERKERIRLMIVGNDPDHPDSVPGITSYPWIIKDILGLYPYLKEGIEKTSIIKRSKSDIFFKALFKVYTPARPLQLFDDYDQAFTWLNQ